MKICPKAPQAAKERMAGKIEGLRAMNANAAESSLLVSGVVEKEKELGTRGEIRR